jgi:hypothetical protein
MNTITLEDIKESVQISNVFILPLLNFSKAVQPIESYLGIKGLDIYDGYSLVLLFHNEHPEHQKQLTEIKASKHYDYMITDNEFDIVIFDMSEFDVEYDLIINGHYSSLPQKAKILINYHRSSNKKALVGIHPEYYYEQYANLLDVDVNTIKGHELMPPPSAEEETLSVTNKILFFLKEQYLIVD